MESKKRSTIFSCLITNALLIALIMRIYNWSQVVENKCRLIDEVKSFLFLSRHAMYFWTKNTKSLT